MMKKTEDQIVDACAKNILREIAVWKNIQENGCYLLLSPVPEIPAPENIFSKLHAIH